MPPTPTEYQILKNLQAALRGITKAAGYHFDLANLAIKLDPNSDVKSLAPPDDPSGEQPYRPFILLEVNTDKWAYSPAKLASLTLPFGIHWVNDYVPTVDDSRFLTYFQGCADVERAIAADVSRGGLAVDTRIVGRTYDTAVDCGAQVWAHIDIEVLTRRVYGQPDA